MANNINKIWELMGINPETGTGTYKNRMGLGNAITRDNGIPLDLSSLHASYNDAVVYAATSSIAYVDQIVAAEGVVYIITADSQGKATIDTYKDSITGKIVTGEAKEYDIFLKPVGTIPGFDEADNGTLPQIQIDDEGNRSLVWVPISAIVEGDGNTTTEVKAASNETRVTVDSAYDQDADKYTYSISINVEDKADAEQVADDIAAAKEELAGTITTIEEDLTNAIADAKSEVEGKVTAETEAREAAIGVKASEGVEASGLYAEIASALQAAKDYADAGDADTVYDDTALVARVDGLEDRIDDIEDVISNETDGLIKQIADLGTALSDEADRAAAAEAQALADAKAYTDEEIAGLSVVIEQKEGVEFIIVKDKSGNEVASANASKFVQDSFLNDVSYDSATRKVSFTWTMGDGSTKTDEIDIADLVDTYTAGNGLIITGNEFAIDETIVATKSDIADVNDVLDTKLNAEQVDDAIDAKLVDVNTEIAKKADAQTTTDALALKANAADVASTVEGLETAIAAKADAEATTAALATKVDKETYEADKGTFATKTELQSTAEDINEVINDLADSVYSKTDADAKFATIENVADTYATKEELTPVATTANNAAAKVTNLEDKIKEITEVGGEPNSIEYIKVNGEIQTPDSEKAVDIAIPVISNVKVSDLKDGGEIIQDIADLVSAVDGHTSDINLINQKLSNEQTGLSVINQRVSALEAEVRMEAESRIDALEGQTAALITTTAGHTTDIANLVAEDTKHAAAIEANSKAIQANTEKFADYRTIADSYSKSEVDDAIDEVVAKIDFTPYATNAALAETNAEVAKKADAEATTAALELKANAADVYSKTDADAKFMTEAQVDARVNTLIDGANAADTITNVTNLITFVNDNAGDIAQLVTDVKANSDAIAENATAIANNDAAIKKNATDISDLADALATATANLTINETAEIKATAGAEGGIDLSVKEVNVNKLVQTEGDVLILNGGSATV